MVRNVYSFLEYSCNRIDRRALAGRFAHERLLAGCTSNSPPQCSNLPMRVRILLCLAYVVTALPQETGLQPARFHAALVRYN
jgi:hypothetical protein